MTSQRGAQAVELHMTRERESTQGEDSEPGLEEELEKEVISSENRKGPATRSEKTVWI